MPKVEYVETTIARIEKFPRVAFVKNGVDVKGNKKDMPQYPFIVAAPSGWTVALWKQNRIGTKYPGYDIKVFLSNGMEAAGNMKLSTVRGER
ncbi:MAG: hypothetical protein IJ617_07100 [Oscillospiraceae bacterium]|nr:hypothetical protein [Oscillospiraceae bacterium]